MIPPRCCVRAYTCRLAMYQAARGGRKAQTFPLAVGASVVQYRTSIRAVTTFTTSTTPQPTMACNPPRTRARFSPCYSRTQALRATSSFLRHVYGQCPAVYAPVRENDAQAPPRPVFVDRPRLDIWMLVFGQESFSEARCCPCLLTESCPKKNTSAATVQE